MSQQLLFIILFSLFSSFNGFKFIPRMSSALHASSNDGILNDVVTSLPASQDISPISSDPWWSQDSADLRFKCTGCGRCCLNDGEVWMDGGEFNEVADFMNISLATLMDDYTDMISGGWAKMKNYVSPITNQDKCIFLAEDNKECTIYSVRPNQCRTYPWWPRLLFNDSNWKEEACVPDDTKDGKKWSAETGGCEGINHVDATTVDLLKISRNFELSSLYTKFGPTPSIMTQDEERSKFLQKTEIMKAVTKSTRVWVKDFVVKYNLCPFAEGVLTSSTIRYQVFLGKHDLEQIIEFIKFEMLHLLTTPEEEISTTLIMLPFAFQDFAEFNDFSIELEDEIVPAFEKESRPAYTVKNADGDGFEKQAGKESKLKKLFSKRKSKSSGECPLSRGKEDDEEIQIAAFHPAFQYSDTELNDPLNFEKRSPFPTINLLRAAKIREYANEGKTAKIAVNNVESLMAVGGETLLMELQRIINIALD